MGSNWALSGEPSCGHILPLPARTGFGVSFGCFSSTTAAHGVVTLTHRALGPVPWLPPAHCFTLCHLVWAGEDKQVRCLRLSSRALPLQSPCWSKAIQKAQPGQQSERCPAVTRGHLAERMSPCQTPASANCSLTPAPLPWPPQSTAVRSR